MKSKTITTDQNGGLSQINELEEVNRLYFIQDGGPTHHKECFRDILSEYFHHRIC